MKETMRDSDAPPSITLLAPMAAQQSGLHDCGTYSRVGPAGIRSPARSAETSLRRTLAILRSIGNASFLEAAA